MTTSMQSCFTRMLLLEEGIGAEGFGKAAHKNISVRLFHESAACLGRTLLNLKDLVKTAHENVSQLD